MLVRFFDRRDAERGVERDRESPAQDPPARPIHHGRQVHEAARHRDVQVHGINPAHQGEIDDRGRARRIVHRPPTDPQRRRLQQRLLGGGVSTSSDSGWR